MNLKRSQRMQKLVDIETQQSQPVVAKFKADQVALQQQEQALQQVTDQSDQQEKTHARKQSQRQLEERFGLTGPEVFST